MGELKKWSVTYTKHIKQKRKVYQDGFLELHPSSNKILLYDDCEKLLDSRFLKKEEVVQAGGTIAFDSHLVDIGDPEGDHEPTPPLNCQGTYKMTNEKSASLCTHKTVNGFASPANLGKKKAPSNSLSPSQRIIREFKKNEVKKYSTSPVYPDTSNIITTEWQVLYTTHISQKAKKYHDGFLKVVPCGSKGRQIMLYDETRQLLDSRFLKKEEVIKSGQSLSFDGHLVDIGEPEGDCKPSIERNCNAVVKAGSVQNQTHPPTKSLVEWDVMYTTQRTQKSKKYHSGTLKLASCGSYQMQATLLSEDGNILGRMFLKSSENVRTGNTLQLLNYLLEIGGLRTDSKDEKKNSAFSLKDTDLTGIRSTYGNLKSDSKIHEDRPTQSGVSRNSASQSKYVPNASSSLRDENLSSQTLENTRIRAASEILTFIKKPMAENRNIGMNSAPIEEHDTEDLHIVQSDTKNLSGKKMQESGFLGDAVECSSGESLKMQAQNAKKVFPAEFFDLENSNDTEECQPTLTNSIVGSGAADILRPITIIDSSNQWSTSSSGCPLDIDGPKSDPAIQVYHEAASCERSKEVEPGNIITQHINEKELKISCSEVSGVTTPVQIGCAMQSRFELGDMTSEQNMTIEKMDDIPTFDLEF